MSRIFRGCGDRIATGRWLTTYRSCYDSKSDQTAVTGPSRGTGDRNIFCGITLAITYVFAIAVIGEGVDCRCVSE